MRKQAWVELGLFFWRIFFAWFLFKFLGNPEEKPSEQSIHGRSYKDERVEIIMNKSSRATYNQDDNADPREHFEY